MSCGTIKIETSSTDEVLSVGIIGPQGPQGVGVPTGGITGYVLAKASGADYDTEWIFNSGGGGANLSNPPPIGDVTPNTGDFTNLTAVTANFTTAYVGTISASGTATLPHIHGSIAGNLYIHVKNTDTTALSRGTPVYIVGNVGDTDRVEVAAADFDDATKMPAVGLLDQDLAINEQGDAVIVGELDAANTAAFALNQEVFVGNAGTITGSRPTTGQVQSVGTIARVQQNSGVIVVNMQGRRTPDESFASATHAASHATGGSDAIAPSDIGAQSIFVTEALGTITADVTLTAARAKIYTVTANASGLAINLPTTNIQTGDVVQIRFTSFTGQTLAVKRDGSFYGSSLRNGQQATYIAASTAANSWEEAGNNRMRAGTIETAGGPVVIGKSTSGAGVCTEIGIGTTAGTVAAGDHTHTQLHDRSHAITSTSDHTAGNHKVFYSNGSGEVVELALGDSGKVLQSNGASAAPTWETPSGGVSAIGTSAADILFVSGSDIVADDLGADKLWGWDDSASKAIGYSIGSGLETDTTTLKTKITSDPSGVTGADAITNIMSLTQAEYNAIGSPNASTLYIITDP